MAVWEPHAKISGLCTLFIFYRCGLVRQPTSLSGYFSGLDDERDFTELAVFLESVLSCSSGRDWSQVYMARHIAPAANLNAGCIYTADHWAIEWGCVVYPHV